MTVQPRAAFLAAGTDSWCGNGASARGTTDFLWKIKVRVGGPERGNTGRLGEQSCRVCSFGQMCSGAVLGCPGLGAVTRCRQLFHGQL